MYGYLGTSSSYGNEQSRSRRSVHDSRRAPPTISSSSSRADPYKRDSYSYDNGAYADTFSGRYSLTATNSHQSSYHSHHHNSRTRSRSPKKGHKTRTPSPRQSKKYTRSRSKSDTPPQRSKSTRHARSPVKSPSKSSRHSTSSRSAYTPSQSSSYSLPTASLGAELQKVLGEKRKLPAPVNISSESSKKTKTHEATLPIPLKTDEIKAEKSPQEEKKVIQFLQLTKLFVELIFKI